MGQNGLNNHAVTSTESDFSNEIHSENFQKRVQNLDI